MSVTEVSKRATVACPFCGTLNRVDLTRIADRPLIAIDDFRKNRLRLMPDNPLGRIKHNGEGFAFV